MKLRTKLIIAFVVVMIFPVTFALIAMHAFVPGRGAEIQQLYLIAVVLTTAFLILWIYRSVSVPLEKLQRAARNIKEGNLDFEADFRKEPMANFRYLLSFTKWDVCYKIKALFYFSV